MDIRKVYGKKLIELPLKAYISGVVMLALLIITSSWWFASLLLAEHVPTRAVTHAEHSSCTDMPHGSQVMENKRLACFNELYEDGRGSL